ncbi:MAG: hypothetical protein COW00_10980 [Bdellovibrio sp. CG12_big_fil_rev_8_21_14_0_65_39_13]|nr:MAG: hypothetical protein COW78_16335 [Bdellovibrio sp. CG22_combo_CG10-13_8_21_14_all_39_27]PIQ59245.1 MAG: hypothetical protein COW00_10980 [Bdellovibrio sp. CG12_big_fil_rev_8_21_14_0_65_39_13]PIR32256.1 MAG: hypothetical protein COV37_20270 [Bdellovibrio sp. CG11_big_fil_rev_8_21_14_0_20_39_38]PJB53973.1 MAG: hypothetical protein CO099_04165 [Bdellovibrio sp. CG_4_9_14_3_um_filter_39_7]
MGIQLHKIKLPYAKTETHALIFLPDPASEVKKGFGIFTHGFTSHKGSILNWPVRLAEEGLACILFDLPGHYLGNYSEVESLEEFISEAPKLFAHAMSELKNSFTEHFPLYDHYLDDSDFTVALGGHSLGALLSLHAISLPAFHSYKRIGICVGLGMPPEGVTHLFDTPFYKSTLQVRAQLVSPALNPDVVFPWIKKDKEELELSGERLHFITGEDDLVVGKTGTEQLVESLRAKGNDVSIEKPAKLAHQLPEMAAAHVKKFLKDFGLL